MERNVKQKYYSIFKLFAAFFAVTVLMFVMNHYTPMYFDDYVYEKSWLTGEKITSFSQIFPSMVAHNNLMNGRFVLHFLAQCFFLIGSNAFDILNSFAFAAFILLIYFHSTGSLKKFNLKIFFLGFALVWIFSPAFGESYLWTTGAANYLYGPIIGLAFMVPYRCYSNGEHGKQNIALTIIGSIIYMAIGVAAGWTNENLSLCLIIMQVLFIVSFIITKDKIRLWMITGIIGNIAGAVLMFSSPTYRTRSEIWSGEMQIYSIIKNFAVLLMRFFDYFLILIAIMLLVMVAYIMKNKKNISIAKIRVPLIFLLTAMAFVASTVACDYYPDRAWSACIAFMVIALCSLLAKLNIKFNIKYVINIACIILACVFLCGTYLNAALEVKSVDYAYNERLEYIYECKEKGEKDITLKAIESTSKYSCYSGGGDISVAQWMLRRLAYYYGFDSVTLDQEELSADVSKK